MHCRLWPSGLSITNRVEYNNKSHADIDSYRPAAPARQSGSDQREKYRYCADGGGRWASFFYADGTVLASVAWAPHFGAGSLKLRGGADRLAEGVERVERILEEGVRLLPVHTQPDEISSPCPVLARRR